MPKQRSASPHPSASRLALPVFASLGYAAAVFAIAEDRLSDWSGLLWLKLLGFYPGVLMIAPLMLLGAVWHERRRGSSRSITDILRGFVRSRVLPGRGAWLLLPLVSAVIAGAAYNVFKQRVLPWSGYGRDSALAAIDRALLGGNDAWTLSHRLFPQAWITGAIDALYHPLFFPMTMGIAICTYLPLHSAARFRYTLGYTLLLAGPATIGSWLVPAVGPCFDAALHGAERFVPLGELLAEQQGELGRPLGALDYQRKLVSLFASRSIADGAGIAALPSIHNGLSTLFICFALHLRRTLAWLLVPYAAIVLLGSVHLGWHYGIDGIVGIALAIGTWWATGPIARWAGLTDADTIRAGAPA